MSDKQVNGGGTPEDGRDATDDTARDESPGERREKATESGKFPAPKTTGTPGANDDHDDDAGERENATPGETTEDPTPDKVDDVDEVDDADATPGEADGTAIGKPGEDAPTSDAAEETGETTAAAGGPAEPGDRPDDTDRLDDTDDTGDAREPGERADAAMPRIVPPGDTGEASGPGDAGTEKDDGAPEPADEPSPDGVRLAAATPGNTAKDNAPKSKRPKRITDRRIKYARRAAYVLGVLVALPIIGFVIVYLMTPIPSSAQPAAKAQQSVFYYNDGKTVIARTGEFDRRPVQLSEVPRQVRDAVISAENRSFYNDPGVSMTGSARAVWATLTGGSLQGGSTITQQMVRNYYSGLSQQRTAGRKLKEIMIALKVSREKDKDWILQQYLNTIYFGRDAYGIESAAQAYYNKDVENLTPAEAAYLAAAIQVPSYAGDLSVPGAQAYMRARWQYVVEGMVEMRTITPQEAAALRFPPPAKQKQRSIFAGDKGYMVSQAKAELRRLGYTDNQINMGGLKVRTTFDKDLMAAARSAVLDNIPPGTSKKVLTGLVSIDPDNGEINAFYGGKDYVDRQFNNAFDAKVQAGSGFKPYVLAAALSHGESLNTYVDGSSPQTFAGTALHNDRNENFGMVNLVTATQDSINTAYVNLGQKVGLSKVVQTAEKAGIPAAQLDQFKSVPTLPLGVADVSVEQQAAGYATFASEGMYHAPHVIRSVSEHGAKPRKFSTPGTRAWSTTVARDATYAMQKVVDAGTGTNAALPDRNAAGKTGTTSDGKQLWFNGFIPQLTASVGIFRSDNKPLSIPGYSAYGGDLPARIWRSYMVKADDILDLPVRSFGAPSVYTGGGGRSTTPVTPTRPRPTGPRPTEPVPTVPTHPLPPPTEGPPTGPPTGPPASPQRHRGEPLYHDLYG
jgi:membrane peptidoglycan carboxypeptidase